MVKRRWVTASFMWACLLYAFSASIPALASAIDVGEKSEWSRQLVDQTLVFQDTSGEMTAQQVGALPNDATGFQRIQQLGEPGRISPEPWWSKVELFNSSEIMHSLCLILSPGASFRSVAFYVHRDGVWIPAEQAAHEHSMTGPTHQRFNATDLTLVPGARETLLIRTTGTAPIYLAPYLFSEQVFHDYLSRSSLWNGVLFGGLMALVWTAAMLGFFARSKPFFLLSLLSLVTLLLEALRRGYGRHYFSSEFSEWSYRGPVVLGNLAIVLFVVFVLEIAKSEKVRVPLRKLLLGWVGYLVGVILLAALGDIYLAHWLTDNIRPFLTLTLLVITVLFIGKSVPNRKLMLGIAMFSIARVSLIAFEKHGVLPDFIDNLSVGALRMNPILALSAFFINLTILAGWVAHVGKQRKAALEEIARLQREENQRLVAEVVRQTAALNEALDYADKKNRQQNQIVSYVSHDLRAPLVTISGYVQLLELDARPEQKPQLGAIRRSVDYQMTLIEDILGYATAELRPLALSPTLVPLPEFLDEIVQHATALSTQQRNRFAIDVSSPIPTKVWMDSRRLRQVLLNLLSNAAKFTNKGIISLDLRATQSGSQWQLYLAICDSGAGIDPSRRAQIFDEFYQPDPAPQGFGLGLYIAQSIVKSMGGTLSLESAVGLGSRFSFEISVTAGDELTTQWKPPLYSPTKVKTDSHRDAGPAPSHAMPPRTLRIELAEMAKGGHLSDMENWLRDMASQYPECKAYFEQVGEAIAKLDFDAVEQLAVNPTHSPNDAPR